MKIAFLTRYDPRLRSSESGIPFFMLQALEKYCNEVITLGPVGSGWWLTGKIIHHLARISLRQNVDYTHTVALSRVMGRTFNRKLAYHPDCDLIFAPAASTEIAHLETDIPVVLYGDLTARLLQNYAHNVTNLAPWSVDQLEFVESKALQRANHIVYASEWAARSAMIDYHVPAERISVIPFGANLDRPPTRHQIKAARRAPQPDTCKLIFVGVDWKRKGGDKAVAAMRTLRERGVNATLTVVGCTPPGAVLEQGVKVIPFLDKSYPEQQQELVRLLLESDFMLLPTQREAFGIVCCEAFACGLPVIVSDIDGVPVKNRENGVLLPVEAAGPDYSDAVQSLLNHPQLYLQLGENGRRAFESHFNWDLWGEKMWELFEEMVHRRSRSASA